MRAFIYYLVFIYFVSNSLEIEDIEENSDYYEDSFDDDDDDKQNFGTNKRQTTKIEGFVGTNLFGDNGSNKKCFSSEDVALLTARKEFEYFIPKDLPKCLVNNKFIEIIMQYFYGANQIVLKMTNGNSKIFAQKAFYDALGGYLNSNLIPITKLSFYAGVVSLKSTKNIYELFRQCKLFLNTNGNDWKASIKDFSEYNLNIEPLRISYKEFNNDENDDEQLKTACINLNLADEKSENDEDMIVSLPKLDTEEYGELSNIWLPFKRKHSFNLRSNLSGYILMRYFVAVTKCYRYQGVSQDIFNRHFKNWLQENIELHLNYEILYPGLGGVLRILETLRKHKKLQNNYELMQNKSNYIINKKHVRHGNSDNNRKQEFSKIQSKTDEFLETNDKKNFLEKLFDNNERNDKVRNDFIQNNNDDDDYDDDNELIENKKKFYIKIAIIIVAVLFIFICFVAVITKYMRYKSKSHEKKDKSKDKKETFCQRLTSSCRRKPKPNLNDEEIELGEDSNAILSSNKPARRFSRNNNEQTKNTDQNEQSSSSKTNSPPTKKPTKCIPACMRRNKTDLKTQNLSQTNNIQKNAIITTTSNESLETNIESTPVNSPKPKKRMPPFRLRKHDEITLAQKKFSISKKKPKTPDIPDKIDKTLEKFANSSKKDDKPIKQWTNFGSPRVNQISSPKSRSPRISTSWETIEDKK